MNRSNILRPQYAIPQQSTRQREEPTPKANVTVGASRVARDYNLRNPWFVLGATSVSTLTVGTLVLDILTRGSPGTSIPPEDLSRVPIKSCLFVILGCLWTLERFRKRRQR